MEWVDFSNLDGFWRSLSVMKSLRLNYGVLVLLGFLLLFLLLEKLKIFVKLVVILVFVLVLGWLKFLVRVFVIVLICLGIMILMICCEIFSRKYNKMMSLSLVELLG